ncbi:MAG: hypothetical protein K2F69_04770 [Bacteroidaceae bacterium]|nr:hypothetical protein [Bacteroidaceae bacterium]
MRLATFDIFDTTLLRRCGRPEEVWEQLANRLFAEERDLTEAFVAWRRQAKGDTLAAIYAGIDEAYVTFSGKSEEELMQAEKEEERATLIVNPEIRSIIERKRKEGWTIAFVSDMYLDSHFLQSVLSEQQCIKEGERIYVSCEHRARKDDGTLYDVVRRDCAPVEWEHYGDNWRSDVAMARKKGIRAIAVTSGFNVAEAACLRVAPHLAALSRLFRLQHPRDGFAAFAADFVVPAYLPYAAFVLTEARRMGIAKLYFLSRDSYVLLKAAQAMLGDTQGPELHYLFVSRRSLLLPYLWNEDEKAYLAARDHNTIVRLDSVDKMLVHLGTTREELRERYGIEFAYTRVNNLAEQVDFLKKIFHSDFTPLLQQRAQEQQTLLLDYFRQEGLLDGVRCAAVDVGWLGTSRLMINHILRRQGVPDIHFFYYGVRGDVFPPSAGRYTAYFQAGELSTEATVLLEHYFSASPYPTTVGYQRNEDGQVIPQFKTKSRFAHTPASKANAEAMESMAADLPHCDKAMLRQWARSAISSLMSSHLEVDITPLVPTSDFDDNTPFVKKLNIAELVKLLVLGGHVTGFDLGSLRLTLPLCMLAPAWRLHESTGRLRGYLYRRIYRQ